jgi:hypothetical protein
LYWPDLPKNDKDYPRTVDGWRAYPKHYNGCFNNTDFRGIFAHFDPTGYSILKIITRDEPGAAAIIIEDEKQGKDVATGEDEVESTNPDSTNPEGNGETEMDMDLEDEVSFSGSFETQGEEPMPYDADGNPFHRVQYTDEDQPSQSSWIHTGFGQTTVNDMLERITEYVNANHKGEMAVRRGYLNSVQPHFSVISERTIRMASLGGVGLTRYCIEELRMESEVYTEMI